MGFEKLPYNFSEHPVLMKSKKSRGDNVWVAT